MDKISFISKSEFFTAAVKSPEVMLKTIITTSCFVLFRFVFVCLFYLRKEPSSDPIV